MKKITLTLAVISVLSLHADESFGFMQGLADSIFGSDDKTEKKVEEKVSSEKKSSDTVTVVTTEQTEKKEEPSQEKSFGLMQGLADSVFGSSKEEKNMTLEEKKAYKEHITLKEEIDEKEPTTMQNWFDKQLNQGKYNPENMTEEQQKRFLKEEANYKKQRKIDHEKGFTLQSIVDSMFDQDEYSGEKMAK